jgi:hypothetical protein
MHRKNALVLAVIILIAGLAAGSYAFWKSRTKTVAALSPAPAENPPYGISVADIYPLYPGLAWGDKETATINPGEQNVPEPLMGTEIKSQPITNISDLTAVSLPFENYYKKKLDALGWTQDQMLAAGGPGAAVIGYKKGTNYIILEYTTDFKGGGTDSPETCPCDTSFSVFEGSAEK